MTATDETLWWCLLLMISWSLNAEGIYHIPSMAVISRPPETSPDCLFGYSLAYQPATKHLIVSAPNNDDVGKVYDCNLKTYKCEDIANPAGDNYAFQKMWLGATVAANNNFTMACAPRYIEEKNRTGTFGRCYQTAPTERNMTQLELLTDEDKGNLFPYELNLDSLGWSIDVTRQGSILVGGPAMSKGRAVLYTDTQAAPKLFDIAKLSGIHFNFGYSVTSGNFYSGDSNDIIYAVSSTYGNVGIGKVLLSKRRGSLDKFEVLPQPTSHSPKVGAMFGAAMASANLRPFGQRQALLVGAPAYSVRADQHDVGAVYIYLYDVETKKVVHQKTILGEVSGGRFGSAIISLGDLNGDARDEIAVSAPYEETGAVYVYSGGGLLSDNSQLKWLQRITFEGYKAFGLSIAALQDYDDNGCNELAIGSPESNKVVLLKCMAQITVNVKYLTEHKTATHPRARRNETYFVFQSCVDIIYPKKPKAVSADIQVVVRITHNSAKLVTPRKDGCVVYEIQIRDSTKSSYCREIGIIIPSAVDYDPMIQYSVTATQLNSPKDQTLFYSNRALLSDLSQVNLNEDLWVADCAGEKECLPKLNFEIRSTIPKNYTIGSSGIEKMNVFVHNSGDVAFSACAHIGLSGVNVLRSPSTCLFSQDTNVFVSKPKIPVQKDTDWLTDEIELDMSSLNSDSEEITISVKVFPDCKKKESKSDDLTFKLHPDPTELWVRGSTNIGDTVEVTADDLEKSGRRISHDYSVSNHGITNWVNIRCDIIIHRKSFFQDFNVTIDTPASYECLNPEPIKGKPTYKVSCTVTELKKKETFVVMLPIYVLPGTLKTEELNNVTVKSEIILFGNTLVTKSVTSRLKYNVATVPLWIIILAALVGLLIIGIIIFALYECGFLRRKNKDKLKQLRRSVYRQSVRRSQIRESMRSAQRRSGDKQKMIDHENESNNVDSSNDIAADKITGDSGPAEKGNEDHVDEKKYEKNLLNEDNEECKIKKKEQIIKGLQKNLNVSRSNQFLAPPPRGKTD